MMGFLRRFIASERGESFAEVLAAFAVAALAVAMFATTVGVASNMSRDSQAALQGVYESASSVETTTASSPETLTLSLSEYGGQVASGATIGTYEVNVYESSSGSADVFKRYTFKDGS